MKKMFILFLVIFSTTVYAQSYDQFGYVKTKGTKEKAGDRIKGVRIKIKGKKGAYQTNSRGEFSIDGLERKFIIERVERLGYELLDYETTGTNIEVSSEPLRIVMIDKQQLSDEREAILKKLLKELNKYQEKNKLLQLDLSNLQKSLSEMADRLARVDYDMMNEKDRDIHICLEEGNFTKADSLILSKGPIQERINYSQKGDKSILDDCYILATNAILRNEIDSALVLLEQRTEIAPTDIDCLLDAGSAYLNFQTNVQKALDFYSQALLFAKRKFGESHSITIKCNFCIATAHLMQRNFKDAIPILHECIGAFNVPNIPVVYERTEIDYLEDENKNGINIVEAEDSSLVSQLYGMATIIYSAQGNFDLSLKCMKLGKLFSNDDESKAMTYVSTTTALIMAGCFRQALDEIVLPYLKSVEEEPCNIVTAEFYAFSLMCYSNLNVSDSTIIYADKLMNYYDDIKQQGNQYYHLALLGKSSALIALEQYEVANNVISKGEEVFKLYGNPTADILAQFEGNKGCILIGKGDLTGAEESLLKAFSLIIDLSNENNYDYRRIKGILAYNLAEVYLLTERINEAKETIRLAYAELKDLYKSIGYDHNDMIVVIFRMAEIEELSKDYLEAFRSYRMAYAIRGNPKIYEYIENCFQTAYRNKKYKRSKDFKTFKREYKEFTERNILNKENE